MQRWLVRSMATALAVLSLVLAGCVGGPIRRVSEPTVGIQQLSVGADGQWTVELRLQNYSNIGMRFDRVVLTLRTGGESAGELRAEPALQVGPEAADTAVVTFTPDPTARIAIANALADRRSIEYSLEGTLSASTEGRKSREYKVRRNSALSPVPGLPGVMR
jgi:hypothetical protein